MTTANRAVGRSGRVATWIASLLVAAAFVVVLLALTGEKKPPPVAAAAAATAALPGTAGGSSAAYVGTRDCDDSRTMEAVQDPATPWCTIGRAAHAAAPGTTILVGPGRYAKADLDSRQLAVARNLVFRPADARRRPVLGGVAVRRVDGLTFEGFLFVGGISIRESTNVRVVDNGFASSTIYIRNSRRVMISRNRIRDVRGTSRALLAQGFNGPGKINNEDLVISGNLFDGVDHDAIAVYNGYKRLLIENNRIFNVRQPANFPYHSDAAQITGGEELTFTGNVIKNITHGVLIAEFGSSTDLKVTNNLITNTNGAGLQVLNAPNGVVANNTVWGTRFGTIILTERAAPSPTSVRLSDNVLDKLEVGKPSVLRVASGNVFGRSRMFGRPQYRGRPAFVDAARGDFRIRRANPGAGLPRNRPVPGAQLKIRYG